MIQLSLWELTAILALTHRKQRGSAFVVDTWGGLRLVAREANPTVSR